MRAAFFVLIPAVLAGCAARPEAGGPRRTAEPEIDAVFPAGDGWRAFRLRALRHARVPADPASWRDGVPAGAEWLALAAPSGPFRPVQAVPARRGHFYLVDAASARLCLYDADAGLISTFPLPAEFTPFPAGRAAVYRGADDAFTFLDYVAGEAWQFAGRQTSEGGAANWIPRGRVKMPAGLRDCAQVPGAEDLLCRGSGGSPLRFDGALNRVPAGPAARAAETGGARALWDPAAGQWILEGLSASGEALFRHRPAEKRWEPPSSPP